MSEKSRRAELQSKIADFKEQQMKLFKNLRKLWPVYLIGVGVAMTIQLLMMAIAPEMGATALVSESNTEEPENTSVVSITSSDIHSSEEACLAASGDWFRFYGLSGKPRCVLPTGDADKPCSGWQQCEGLCLAEPGVNQDSGGDQIGFCSSRDSLLGCHMLVQDGKAQPMCID